MARFSLKDMLEAVMELGAAETAQDAAADLLEEAREDATVHPGEMAARRVARAESYMELVNEEVATARERFDVVAQAAAHGDLADDDEDDGGAYVFGITF